MSARLCGQPKISDGQPCQQTVGPNRQTCCWHAHDATPADRQALARKGALTSIHRPLLPLDTPIPRWRSRTQIVQYLEWQAHLVGTGQLDPKVASEVWLHADTCLKAYELSAMEKLDEFERKMVKGRRIA